MSGELPYIFIEDLTVIFNYKNVESTQRAISRGTFPLPTYRIGQRRVADREVVRAFFRKMRDEGMAAVG